MLFVSFDFGKQDTFPYSFSMTLKHLSAIVTIALTACASIPQNPPSPDDAAGSSAPPSDVEVVADNLRVPWDIAFLPSGDMLVTERPGTLLRIGVDKQRHAVEGVLHVGEGGLLGIALHPQFTDNNWVYVYLTTQTDAGIRNRVERYTYADDQLSQRTEILTNIPGAANHDGGELAFGPDGYLYVTTGDAGNANSAQDVRSLAGKILRLRDDGTIPEDNPFGSPVYSYGHRNPQGLAWDADGQLWSTEHGRSGALSGYDELNRIDSGKNYGWPVIQGSEQREGMESPVLHSGARDTWAPASIAYVDGKIFFSGLRGESLYDTTLADGGTSALRMHFVGRFGRIRATAIGPDGMLYITTSNTDSRGRPRQADDKILRVDPSTFPE